MNLRLRVNQKGIERTRTILQALTLTNSDREGPILRVLDRLHNDQVRLAFRTGGSSVASGPWPAWSPDYAKWRAKHVGRLGRTMMFLTGTLYGKATSPNHGDHVAEFVPPFGYRFGFADEVGFWHQEGAGQLPKRSLIDKTDSQYRAFTAAFTDFYLKRIRQVVRRVRA